MTPVGMPYDLNAKCSWDGDLLHIELPETPKAIHVHHPCGSTFFGVPTRVEQELRSENAKLREQIERLVTLLRNDCDIDASWDGLRGFWLIGLTENGCLMRDRACKAEAENAKLKELLARVDRARRDLCDAYPDAELLNCEQCPAWSACRGDLMDRMRELGVEVKE